MSSADHILLKLNQLRIKRDLAWRLVGYAYLAIILMLIVGVSTYLLLSATVGLPLIMIAGALTLALICSWVGYINPIDKAIRDLKTPPNPPRDFNSPNKDEFRSRSLLLDTPPPRSTLA